MTKRHHKGPDPAIRPFRGPSKSLMVDLFLRGIPEIAGSQYARSPRDMLRRIRARQQAAEDTYTLLLNAGVGVRQFELAREFPHRLVANNYESLLKIVASNWPNYAQQTFEIDLNSREQSLISQRGKQEPDLRKKDWKKAVEQLKQIRLFPTKLKKAERQTLENEFNLPQYTRPMLVDIYPGVSRRIPLRGCPSFVQHRSKTIDSLARKTFIRMVQQMSDEEAANIAKVLKKDVDNSANHLFPFAYDLNVYDALGITLVYPTLADRDAGISIWWSGVNQYNSEPETEGKPSEHIRIAKDSDNEPLEEDYADPRQAKDRPYEAAHKTWIVGKNPEPVEVCYNTLWGFATGLAKNTRLSHRLYDSRKGWQRKTTDGKPWTDAHRFVYNELLGFARKQYEPLGVHFPE